MKKNLEFGSLREGEVASLHTNPDGTPKHLKAIGPIERINTVTEGVQAKVAGEPVDWFREHGYVATDVSRKNV